MPDSARQNAQPGAPASSLRRIREWSAGKKKTGGRVVRGALCLVISVLVLLGTYGAVGGTFFQQANCAHSSCIFVGRGEAKFSIAEREVPHSF